MMKILKCFIAVLLFFLLASFSGLKEYNATIYLLRENSDKLSPVNMKIYASDNTDFCEKLISEIISQQNRPYIPLVPKKTKIRAEKSAAVIDFPPQLLDNEVAAIYSLVNSVTSTGDIITVEFTASGKKNTDFFKQTSINETFIPDYNI